jgi:putative copper export protein
VALVARTSVSTRFGLVVAIATTIAIVGACAAAAAARAPRLAGGAWLAGLALVVLPSAMGHALDPGRSWIQFPVDVLHVAAASVWFGGVVALVTGLRRGVVDDRVLRRFSTLALAAVGVIGVTGLVRAFAELSSIDQIWGTSYGRLLIVKTTLLGVLVVLGWTNRYRLIPALARSAQRLRLNLRAEIVLLLAVVGAVALLTQSRPGRDRVLASPAAAAVASRAPATPAEAVVLAQAPGAVQVAGVAANSVSVDGNSVLGNGGPRRGGIGGRTGQAEPRDPTDTNAGARRRVAVRSGRDEECDRLRGRVHAGAPRRARPPQWSPDGAQPVGSGAVGLARRSRGLGRGAGRTAACGRLRPAAQQGVDRGRPAELREGRLLSHRRGDARAAGRRLRA